MKKFKVLHLSYSKSIPIGVLNQIRSEFNVFKDKDIDWSTLLITTSNVNDKFAIKLNSRLPTLFQMAKVYIWCYRNKNNYDIILMRNIKSDLVGWLFIPFIRNIVTIHHTKEIEECRIVKPNLYGLILSIIEVIFGTLKINFVAGIAGVTNEIVEYEQKRVLFKKPSLVIPNGIKPHHNKIDIKKDSNSIEILFIASRFEVWHGLEKLLDSFFKTEKTKIKLHIVGELITGQKELIDKVNKEVYDQPVIYHGFLTNEKLNALYTKCSMGLGSFALEEKNLFEASTLKVREYLNNGLLVYSGHKDSGLPDKFPYYRVGEPELKAIIDFNNEMKSVPKERIRRESNQFIDKSKILRSTYLELKKRFG